MTSVQEPAEDVHASLPTQIDQGDVSDKPQFAPGLVGTPTMYILSALKT